MNNAIQKQLEERIMWLQNATTQLWPEMCLKLIRENASLRQLCAYVLEAVQISEQHDLRQEEIAQLEAAAEGRPVT